MDGVPMTVDFRLKSAARAKIPRNWLRRDLAPNDYETLTSRMIDRSLRGAFPAGYCNETQVLCCFVAELTRLHLQLTCNVLSAPGDADVDILCANGAAAALAWSDIPWALGGDGLQATVRATLLSNGEVCDNCLSVE